MKTTHVDILGNKVPIIDKSPEELEEHVEIGEDEGTPVGMFKNRPNGKYEIWISSELHPSRRPAIIAHEIVEGIACMCDLQLDHTHISTIGEGFKDAIKFE